MFPLTADSHVFADFSAGHRPAPWSNIAYASIYVVLPAAPRHLVHEPTMMSRFLAGALLLDCRIVEMHLVLLSLISPAYAFTLFYFCRD